MDNRAKFWARYLPIKEVIKDNIHHPEVEKAFKILFDQIFINKHKITQLPTRMKFEILDMMRYYQYYEYFLKDFYLTYKKKLNEYQEIEGYGPYQSFYDFETKVGLQFGYFANLDSFLSDLEKTLINK